MTSLNSARDESWDAKYNALLQFCEEHGHCNAVYRKVVTLNEKPFRIGKFVVDQRKLHEEGNLEPEKDALLQALVDQGKFQWNCITNSARSDEFWPDMFQALVSYCKISPVKPVVTVREDAVYEDENGKVIPVGRWMHTQNRFRRRNKLRVDRVARFQTELIDTGLFTWQQRKNSPEVKAKNLQRLAEVIERKTQKKAAEESDSTTFIVAQTLTNPKAAIEQRLKAERKKQAAATNNGVSVPVQLISSNAFSSSSSSNTNSTSTTQLEVAATAADHAVESLASRLNIKNASRAGDDLVAKHSNVRRVKTTEGDSNDNSAKKKGGKRKVPAVVDEVVVETADPIDDSTQSNFLPVKAPRFDKV